MFIYMNIIYLIYVRPYIHMHILIIPWNFFRILYHLPVFPPRKHTHIQPPKISNYLPLGQRESFTGRAMTEPGQARPMLLGNKKNRPSTTAGLLGLRGMSPKWVSCHRLYTNKYINTIFQEIFILFLNSSYIYIFTLPFKRG